MSYPTTQPQQIKWIFQETGRQLLAPVTGIRRIIDAARESRDLDRFMEETLIDPGLIDRILGDEGPDAAALFCQEVPEARTKPVFNPRPFKSLDGILAR